MRGMAALLGVLVVATVLPNVIGAGADTGQPVGVQLDYVSRNTPVLNVPVGQNGTPGVNTTLWLQGSPVTYDGATQVCITTYIAAMEPDFHQSIVADIYEGTTDLGSVIDASTGESATNLTRDATSGFGELCLVPTAGEHTYTVRLWSTGGTLNRVYAGGGTCNPGDSCGWAPSFMRITKAADVVPAASPHHLAARGGPVPNAKAAGLAPSWLPSPTRLPSRSTSSRGTG